MAKNADFYVQIYDSKHISSFRVYNSEESSVIHCVFPLALLFIYLEILKKMYEKM